MPNEWIKSNLTKNKYILIIQFIVLLYSFSGIFSKTASMKPLFSLQFFVLYLCSMCILLVYAILWQRVLKHIPLSTAYTSKAIGIIWGFLWGSLFFHERITTGKILGAILVAAGVVITIKGDE